MKNFDEQLLRLKQIVKLTADQDVAMLLGMTKAAFSDRKKRGAFPEDKLGALAAQRPELLIDVNYVLTGKRSQKSAFSELSQAGNRIREVRGERTVAEFAAQIGTTAEAVSKVEAGEEWLSNELLGRIIEQEKLSPMWLLRGELPVPERELTHIEKVLLSNYRGASAEGQKALEVQAAFFATNNAAVTNQAPPEPKVTTVKSTKKRTKKA